MNIFAKQQQHVIRRKYLLLNAIKYIVVKYLFSNKLSGQPDDSIKRLNIQIKLALALVESGQLPSFQPFYRIVMLTNQRVGKLIFIIVSIAIQTIPRYKINLHFIGLTSLIVTPSATVRATMRATECYILTQCNFP